MRENKRAAILLWMPFMLLHEACHYFAARVLGLRVRFANYFFVTFYPDRTDWRVFAVMLAPALVGLLAWIVFVWFVLRFEAWILVLLSGFLFIVWETMCGNDFANVWHYFRHGKWATDIYTVPQEPERIFRR